MGKFALRSKICSSCSSKKQRKNRSQESKTCVACKIEKPSTKFAPWSKICCSCSSKKYNKRRIQKPADNAKCNKEKLENAALNFETKICNECSVIEMNEAHVKYEEDDERFDFENRKRKRS